MSRARGERLVCARAWRLEAALVLLAVLLAAGLRLYRLDRFPPGLHFDEAFNGFSARQMLESRRPQIFFPDNMGQEPMYTYLVAAGLAVLGEAPWIIRLASAACGILTVALAWWLGREMSALDPDDERGPRAREVWLGVGTALVLAMMYWHLSLSRMGMEPITVPLMAVLTFSLLCRGLNTGRRGTFVLAGLALGGSIYTYKAGYFVPVLAALFVAYAAMVSRGFLRRHGRNLVLLAIVAVVAVAPLAAYFAIHPEHLFHRPGDVVPGAADAAAASWLDNVPNVLGMFFVRGDSDPRNNLPGRPALDLFLTILFVLGLARAVADVLHRRLGSGLALLWLAVMSAPTLLTVEAPHFRRAIGATPAIAFLCALGAWAVWKGVWLWSENRLSPDRRAPGRDLVRIVAVVVLAFGLGFSTFSTARAYFVTWGQSADAFFAYDVGLVNIARLVDELPGEEMAYLTPTARDHFTLRFLARRPLASFDGREGTVYPPPGRPATVIVQLLEDAATLPALQRARPDGRITWAMDDPWGRPYAAAYRLPAHDEPAPAPARPAGARLGDSIELLGYTLEPELLVPGQAITLTLFWQSREQPAQNYTVFTHLLGPTNPATNGPVWAGHDSQPDGGHYPTGVWQPGETILDVHRLSLPPDAPPGEYQIEVGLYLLDTLERLPAAGLDGEPWPDDAIILASLEAQQP